MTGAGKREKEQWTERERDGRALGRKMERETERERARENVRLGRTDRRSGIGGLRDWP